MAIIIVFIQSLGLIHVNTVPPLAEFMNVPVAGKMTPNDSCAWNKVCSKYLVWFFCKKMFTALVTVKMC